jgi:hypothetical protein
MVGPGVRETRRLSTRSTSALHAQAHSSLGSTCALRPVSYWLLPSRSKSNIFFMHEPCVEERKKIPQRPNVIVVAPSRPQFRREGGQITTAQPVFESSGSLFDRCPSDGFEAFPGSPPDPPSPSGKIGTSGREHTETDNVSRLHLHSAYILRTGQPCEVQVRRSAGGRNDDKGRRGRGRILGWVAVKVATEPDAMPHRDKRWRRLASRLFFQLPASLLSLSRYSIPLGSARPCSMRRRE